MTDEIRKDNEIDEEIVVTDEEGNPLKKKKTAATADADFVSEENGVGDDTIKKLREKLEVCVEEKQKYLDNWQRDKAEFLNARKRDKEANEQLVKYAKEDLLADLIPVLDSFDMAFGNKEAWEKVDKNWRMGVEFIHTQLMNVLGNNKLCEINPLGQKFDPTRDEAVEYEKVTDPAEDHIITKVVQKGYSLNGKILKAPKVKVGELAQ
jgi:molecular chaperone GrpE